MCCCCPQAVSALFCLWARSGFSKASVAGALTFFPPEPPLYKFTRFDKDGQPLEDDSSDDEDETNQKGKYKRCNTDSNASSGEVQRNAGDGSGDFHSITTGKKPETGKNDASPNTNNREDEFQELDLVARLKKLRNRAKIRNMKDARDAIRGVTYGFDQDSRLASPPPFSGTINAIKIGPDPKTKNYIAALLYRLRPERQNDDTKTIIYSHGNATDIGAMNFLQAVLAKGLQCNVLMYDYSGYGASGGVALEENTYRDIKLVYKFTKEHVASNADERKIIIYGQSVGSGPSCFLCAKKTNVGGLILHSPFMSGMRVLTPNRLLACLDIFPNIDRIKRVQCPVMIMHGELDEEVPISHGKALHRAVRKDLRRTPWWVPNRGHNDVTDGRDNLVEYIERLKRFMANLD